MEVKAHIRHLHIAPRKVRLAAHLIKGMEVGDAERELARLVKRARDPLHKLLQSAVANARHNFLAGDGAMTIKDVRVNAGPVQKRFRPRAFGRAAPIRRRTSHIMLTLEVGSAGRAAREEEAPSVREATREDLRRAAEQAGKPESREAARAQKPKASGAIRRVFQRKAI